MKYFQILANLLFLIGFSTTALQAQNDSDIPSSDVQTIADDLVVQGSECVGLDCVSAESFGFDTQRYKENNLRMHFDDTSASAGFPANDWRFTFNDQTNGGENYFSIDDATAGRQIFRLQASAPSNSFYMSSAGKIGLGTNTPVLDLHIAKGNTPAMRLEQNTSSGFTAQTWDIAGNEANFFVRDVTNGSKIPFKIIPNAPTNTLVLAANGAVGIEILAPNANASIHLAASDKGLLLNKMTNAERTAFEVGLVVADQGLLLYDTDDRQIYSWDGTQWQSGGLNTDDQVADVFQLNGNDLELSLEDDGVATQTVDLSGYLDNTDDQALSLTGNSLDLEDGGSVDLSGYLDNTDDQGTDVFQLNGNDLELSLEDDGVATQTVDLSGYLDNTDDQALSLTGNTLDLEDGGSVDLSGYLDNTDDQMISLTGNNLNLENGGSVNLSQYLDNTDNQNISGSSLINNVLLIGIENGTSQSIDLSPLQDGTGTDNQNLNLSANTLSISGGNSVNLSGYVNTDNQQISGTLTGTDLVLSIDNGTNVTVDLSPLIADLQADLSDAQDEINTLNTQMLDVITRLEVLEDCACDPLGVVDNIPGERQRAILYQNIPNPFNDTSMIKYFLPVDVKNASMTFSNTIGQIVSRVVVDSRGEGELNVNTGGLASGIYYYILYADGQKIDTKKMVIE